MDEPNLHKPRVYVSIKRGLFIVSDYACAPASIILMKIPLHPEGV